MQSSRPRLPEGVESVFLGLCVGSGLSLLSLALTLFRNDPLADALRTAGIQAGLAGGFGLLAWGLFTRRRWAFLATFATSSILTALTLVAGAAIAWELATFREDCHYGGALVGLYIAAFLILAALLIFGLPIVLLWRDRKRF